MANGENAPYIGTVGLGDGRTETVRARHTLAMALVPQSYVPRRFGRRVPPIVCAACVAVFASPSPGCSIERRLGLGPQAPEVSVQPDSGPRSSAGMMGAPATAGVWGPEVPATAGQVAPPPRVALPPSLIDEASPKNPAGLSEAAAAALRAGGALGEMRFLYPYDGTVFPGGSIAPLVMWTGNAAPDAVYLHIQSRQFEYRGVLKPSFAEGLFIPMAEPNPSTAGDSSWKFTQQAQKQVVIPQYVWDAAAALALGSRDPISIEVTERVDGVAHGPVSARVTIARGSLQGSIYYNSCYVGTATDPGVENNRIGARVLRIPPRGNAEVVSGEQGCVGCHSVAANGLRLVAQRGYGVEDVVDRSLNPNQPLDRYTYALSVPLLPDAKPDLAAGSHVESMGAYGALYPDGSKYLAASGQLDAGHLSRVSELVRPASSVLMDAVTGEVIEHTGIPAGATMPNFSPDGRQLVFNDAGSQGYRLALMDYDVQNHKATNYRVLVDSDPSQRKRPGWPFFLPDGRAVVFVQTDSEEFTSLLTTLPNAVHATSDLYIVDVATKQVSMLARAMGFVSVEAGMDPASYVPFGMDMHRNHFPTVAPTAAGGYFWMYFDSVRDFGSMGLMRALWGSAIDIHPDGNGGYALDVSHPPFFVPGQEFVNTGHFRAFAALNRCVPDGDGCESGINCCSGVCTPENVCGQRAPNVCARREERCETTADCCESTDYCINNFCSFVELL